MVYHYRSIIEDKRDLYPDINNTNWSLSEEDRVSSFCASTSVTNLNLWSNILQILYLKLIKIYASLPCWLVSFVTSIPLCRCSFVQIVAIFQYDLPECDNAASFWNMQEQLTTSHFSSFKLLIGNTFLKKIKVVTLLGLTGAIESFSMTHNSDVYASRFAWNFLYFVTSWMLVCYFCIPDAHFLTQLFLHSPEKLGVIPSTLGFILEMSLASPFLSCSDLK